MIASSGYLFIFFILLSFIVFFSIYSILFNFLVLYFLLLSFLFFFFFFLLFHDILQVGLPPPAVIQKMMSDGVVSTFDNGQSILALGGEGISPEQENDNGSNVTSAPVSAMSSEKSPQIALKDHPSYTKYFKMLKVGLDKDNVRFKMEQDGISADILDRDPNTLISIDDNSAGDGKDDEVVPISYHPSYGKYFRMLSVRLPKDAIKAKMQQDGLNPDYLDKSPLELIARGPLNPNSSNEHKSLKEPSEIEYVSFMNHPVYGKYFKMLKVGLPSEAVKAKMIQEGVDPDYLDKDSNELIPVNEIKKEKSTSAASSGRIKSQRIKSQRIKSVHTALTALGAGAKGGPKVRKKKLYWKALDDSKVGGDSLWAEKDDDIALDEAEFNLLFVET